MRLKLAVDEATRRWGKRAASCTAFTLVELLVVIAVMAILAAMLLPALNRANTAADSAVCRNNLRQIGIGMNMYVQQYSSYLSVNGLVTNLQPFLNQSWPANNIDYSDQTNPRYLRPGTGVYACPGYNRLRGWFSADPAAPYDSPGSYCYNSMGALAQGLGPARFASDLPLNPPAREGQVISPSDMIGMFDATLTQGMDQTTVAGISDGEFWQEYDYLKAVLQGVPAGWATPKAVQGMKQRHNGKWNVMFCDAHVESFTAAKLFNVTNSMVDQRWNRDHQVHNGFCVPGNPF